MSAPGRLLLFTVALSFGLVACGAESGDDDGIDDSDTNEAMLSEECKKLPSGPFEPVSLGQPFKGSEDFTFDGHGRMIGRRGNDIIRINNQGKVTSTLGSLPGPTLGMRFSPKGVVIGAMVNAGKLVSVTQNGQVTDLVKGLNGPNGVFVDLESNVWFTEGGANRVSRLSPDGTRKTIVSGAENAQGANGIVVDAATKRLFYTEFDKGKIHRVDLAGKSQSPVHVATIPGAGLDGLVLDTCGNLYVMDQRHAKLFRIRLGSNGAATRAPELLATFPVNVANAQFGSGSGFDPKTLFVAGNPGSVFAVPVGIAGARVAIAP